MSELQLKYELVGHTSAAHRHMKYRVKALFDFADVNAGDLGGFVNGPDNLSQNGNCWVYDEAELRDECVVKHHSQVRGTATMHQKACLYGSAKLVDNASLHNLASAFDNAVIKDDAVVLGTVTIHDCAVVGGDATVRGQVSVRGSAVISGSVGILDRARIGGRAVIYGGAVIEGSSYIGGDAVICQEMTIRFGCVTVDLTKSLKDSLRCQTGLVVNPVTNTVICYKRVTKDLRSHHDPDFVYVVGEYAEADNPIINNDSCQSGLHFSYATYWDENVTLKNSVLLCCEVHFDDIITVQDGKIRAKKCFVHGICD